MASKVNFDLNDFMKKGRAAGDRVLMDHAQKEANKLGKEVVVKTEDGRVVGTARPNGKS